jgi:hypothetical protein
VPVVRRSAETSIRRIRSLLAAGWPYFDGTFRDYPAFKRKFEPFRANYHRGTPTLELF